jgi:RNA polymerase sigma-70 factor (ECF subfamily)
VTPGLGELYAATYPRLVAELALLTGSRADAEEVVQDAFVRLVPRWSRVSAYDDPAAWLRRVAHRLAVSRWRRTRVAAAAAVRLRPRDDVAPADGVDLDLLRALATLPLAQRQAVLLHHLADQPVERIAADLGVAVGTVKSRLARGRAALAARLGDDVEVER